jgi:hypothetical protein
MSSVAHPTIHAKLWDARIHALRLEEMAQTMNHHAADFSSHRDAQRFSQEL